MKRIASFLLALVLCLTLCACANNNGTQEDNTATFGNTMQQENTASSVTIGNTENTGSSENTEHTENNEPVHLHTWVDATCTAPKTCASCGATEGNTADHNWNAATCTAPKTCTTCGTTEGNAAGHNWKDATCSDPKTCTICGTTSGLTAGHTFSDGKCTQCGKADPDSTHETMVWIPTKGGTKYHTRADCSNMKNPENVTKSKAESLGFTPCKRCH